MPPVRGRHVDVSMSDCSLVLLANLIARFEDPADVPPRGTRRADMGLWRCADGEWLVTTDMEPRYWATFCEAMGKPEYAAWQLDPARRWQIREGFQAIFATRPRDHWLAHLEAAGTQFAPVNSLADALDEPHFRDRGMVIALDAPGGALTQAGPPVRLGPFPPPEPAVLPGTHTAEILRGLDLTDTQINALARTPAQQTGPTTPAQH